MAKRKILFSTLIAIAGIYISDSAFAQSTTLSGQGVGKELNTITTSVPFLLISPDARAGCMGDVGVATSPDANSMHWNPAKYAFVKKQTGISISYTPWLRALVPDISLAYLAGYYKLKKNGTIATSLRYFSLGDITFTDIIGTTIGQFRPNEFAYDIGYATKLGEHFSGGGALRYIHSNLTGNISVEGSSTHPVAEDLNIGMQNNLPYVPDILMNLLPKEEENLSHLELVLNTPYLVWTLLTSFPPNNVIRFKTHCAFLFYLILMHSKKKIQAHETIKINHKYKI